MNELEPGIILEKLSALRGELVELAFSLERRGRLDAADVALTTSVRLGELAEEFEPLEAKSPLGSGRTGFRGSPTGDRYIDQP